MCQLPLIVAERKKTHRYFVHAHWTVGFPDLTPSVDLFVARIPNMSLLTMTSIAS